jgi:hypothetical protein
LREPGHRAGLFLFAFFVDRPLGASKMRYAMDLPLRGLRAVYQLNFMPDERKLIWVSISGRGGVSFILG